MDRGQLNTLTNTFTRAHTRAHTHAGTHFHKHTSPWKNRWDLNGVLHRTFLVNAIPDYACFMLIQLKHDTCTIIKGKTIVTRTQANTYITCPRQMKNDTEKHVGYITVTVLIFYETLKIKAKKKIKRKTEKYLCFVCRSGWSDRGDYCTFFWFKQDLFYLNMHDTRISQKEKVIIKGQNDKKII